MYEDCYKSLKIKNRFNAIVLQAGAFFRLNIVIEGQQ